MFRDQSTNGTIDAIWCCKTIQISLLSGITDWCCLMAFEAHALTVPKQGVGDYIFDYTFGGRSYLLYLVLFCLFLISWCT